VWWHRRGPQLIGAGSDGEILVWDAATWVISKRMRWRAPHDLPAVDFDLDVAGDKLYILSKQHRDAGRSSHQELLEIELATAERRTCFTIAAPALAAAVHAAGPCVVLVGPLPGVGQQWQVVDTTTGKVCVSSQCRGTPAFTFSRDGRRLAVRLASPQVQVDVWDVPAGKHLQRLKPQRPIAASGVEFSPDGGRLAYATSHGLNSAKFLNLYDLRMGKEILAAERLAVQGGMLAVFSPDGQRIAWVSDNYELTVSDAATGADVWRLRGHSNAIAALAFSHDSRYLASSSADGTIRIWDVGPIPSAPTP